MLLTAQGSAFARRWLGLQTLWSLFVMCLLRFCMLSHDAMSADDKNVDAKLRSQNLHSSGVHPQCVTAPPQICYCMQQSTAYLACTRVSVSRVLSDNADGRPSTRYCITATEVKRLTSSVYQAQRPSTGEMGLEPGGTANPGISR